MKSLFRGIYENRVVLVTGHTGFKGSWLIHWLDKMGAKVIGYSLEASTNPNHFSRINCGIVSITGDICDLNKLEKVFEEHKPEIVFHLAAQPLVRFSYLHPIETYETNVIGTLKVYEASRKAGVKAIVNITSDKSYENKEWVWGYREHDQLGGYDPYSSSKGCADILTTSYRNSYFNVKVYKAKHDTLIASCRAGNVIGGGDWAEDRLIPGIMISASKNTRLNVRNPHATRPWQHVLEPLSGYLSIGQMLLMGKKEFSDAWNFGPSYLEDITVEALIHKANRFWSQIDYETTFDENAPHESADLRLDCSKAHHLLEWRSVWSIETTVERTVKWYRAFYENNEILTNSDLEVYVADAKAIGLTWTQ